MTIAGRDGARIADLLAAAGLGRAEALTSLAGTGNRTFAATGAGFDAVVRLPGDDTGSLVDRHAERANAEAAAALGVAPAVLYGDPADGAMVMARAPGSPIAPAPAAGRSDALARLGACLARLHRGPAFEGRMDPWQKVDAYLARAGLRRGDDADAFGRMWPAVAALRARAGLRLDMLAPCHIDPIPANAIDDGARVLLVDWEYSAMSTPLWDLAYVCVEGALDGGEVAALLQGYGDPSVTPERLRDWRTVAAVVSAAWCMARVALGDAAQWRGEVANRLAALAADLDDGAAQHGAGDGQ